MSGRHVIVLMTLMLVGTWCKKSFAPLTCNGANCLSGGGANYVMQACNGLGGCVLNSTGATYSDNNCSLACCDYLNPTPGTDCDPAPGFAGQGVAAPGWYSGPQCWDTEKCTAATPELPKKSMPLLLGGALLVAAAFAYYRRRRAA